MTNQTRTPVEPLGRLRGLRVWADDTAQLPHAASTLLEEANLREMTPAVILFELCEDSWNVYLVAED